MSLACRRARGTATRLLDLVAFGGRAAGPHRVPAARPFASASLARARELLAPTPFDVHVGATVRVSAPRAWTGAACPTDVDVRVGDAYETVTVQASWTHPEGDADARPPTVTATQTEDGDVAIVASGGAGGRARVACRIPPRFCGVDVASGGGDVHVESVVEATVRVSSDGGAVTFGSVKGAALRVDTDGGKLFAKNVTADAAVDTAGGAVVVDKLVGRRVRVRSLGGDVFVEAAYAAVLDVDTAGGALLMGEARVGKKATLKTRGGVVKLRGFAGDADAFCVVDTAGGACALELRAEAAGSLRVLTRGGDVALGVPEGFAADLRVSGRVDGEEVSLRRREEGENADNAGFESGFPSLSRNASSSASSFANPFAANPSGDDPGSASTTRMVGGTRDVAARKVAAAALASKVVVDARVYSREDHDVEGKTPFFQAPDDAYDAFLYDGFDPFADDDDDVVGAVLDAAEEAVGGVADDLAARPSGDVVVETRSWIASLGLGK
jgi:hypothetical protein